MFYKILYMCIALLIHLIAHEMGHIVFGLLSGHTLVSSQILFFKIKKNAKSIHVQLAPPIWGGITYMIPKNDQQQHYVAYSLGGIIMNALLSILTLCVTFIFNNHLSRFSLIFSIIGFIFVLCNTIPFWVDEWNNDANDVYLFSHNPNAKKSYFSLLQLERYLYTGGDILSVNHRLFHVDNYDDIYSFHLTQIYASMLLLKGKNNLSRELISEMRSTDSAFMKKQGTVLTGMEIENSIISNTTPEEICAMTQQIDFEILLKEDSLIANLLLYALSYIGVLDNLLDSDYYLKQYQKQTHNLGSMAEQALSSKLMTLMKETVSNFNGNNSQK